MFSLLILSSAIVNSVSFSKKAEVTTMGCCGAKEDDQGVSFVAGQMDDGAVASVATIRPTPEQQLAKRAAQLKRLAALPEHLRLGITLPGMRELLSELPDDAVE